MKKIEALAKMAFFNGNNFAQSNTEVKVRRTKVEYYLHGNLIAWRLKNSLCAECSLAGWNTRTTKSRLNSLGANITQRKGIIYADGIQIDATTYFYINL